MKKLNKINDPFGCFCYNLGFRPTVYSEALTYEEQLLWLIDFLQKTVIPAVNENVEAVEELQALYIELKSYVDNYFENLDVQEEINNKLDDMVEQGTLQEIITSYLQVNGVLAYDTVGDMAYSQNLIDGSTCYCLGDLSYNDGKGGFYKVREIVNTDVVDDFNLVALDVSNTLVAERMPDYYINDLQTQINTTNTTLNRVISKKYIFIGDSYATGENEAHEFTTPWTTLVGSQMGLTLNSNLFVSAHNGSGFNNGYGFKNQLDEVYEDIDDPNSITDIVFVGGYNDKNYTIDVIDGKMEECFDYAKDLYPNAKIKLACVGWSRVYTVRQDISKRSIPAYSACSKYGVEYLNNTEWILHNYDLFCADKYHPTQEGQNELAKYLTQAILTGSCDIQRWINIVTASDIEKNETDDSFSPDYCIEYQNNGMFTFSIYIGYMTKTTAVTIGSKTNVALAKLTGGLMLGGSETVVRSGATVFVSKANSTGQAEIGGSHNIKYDATYDYGILQFTSCPRTTSNADIAALNIDTFSITIPGAWC